MSDPNQPHEPHGRHGYDPTQPRVPAGSPPAGNGPIPTAPTSTARRSARSFATPAARRPGIFTTTCTGRTARSPSRWCSTATAAGSSPNTTRPAAPTTGTSATPSSRPTATSSRSRIAATTRSPMTAARTAERDRLDRARLGIAADHTEGVPPCGRRSCHHWRRRRHRHRRGRAGLAHMAITPEPPRGYLRLVVPRRLAPASRRGKSPGCAGHKIDGGGACQGVREIRRCPKMDERSCCSR